MIETGVSLKVLRREVLRQIPELKSVDVRTIDMRFALKQSARCKPEVPRMARDVRIDAMTY